MANMNITQYLKEEAVRSLYCLYVSWNSIYLTGSELYVPVCIEFVLI